MRFRGLDLNLLHALDILLEVRSVSRAAEQLNLTQPAVSAALSRLRDYFDDDLLVVHGSRMYLTPFADRLRPAVATCLKAAENVIATTAKFDPQRAERTFRIICSDYTQLAVIAPLSQSLAVRAPGIRLDFISPDQTATENLSRGDADMMISPAEYLLKHLPMEELYDDTHVVVGCRSNRLFSAEITRASVLEAEHVAVSIGSSRVDVFSDRRLDEIAPHRRIAAVASSFTMVPWLVINTERIAVMFRRLAIAMADYVPIAHAPLPFDFPVMREMVQYHSSRTADEGLHWLIGEMRAAAFKAQQSDIGAETSLALAES